MEDKFQKLNSLLSRLKYNFDLNDIFCKGFVLFCLKYKHICILSSWKVQEWNEIIHSKCKIILTLDRNANLIVINKIRKTVDSKTPCKIDSYIPEVTSLYHCPVFINPKYCRIWSVYFLELRLMNYDIEPFVILEQLLKNINYDSRKLEIILEQYQNTINDELSIIREQFQF